MRIGGAAVQDLVDLDVESGRRGESLRIDRGIENGVKLKSLALRGEELLGGDAQLRVVLDGDAEAIEEGNFLRRIGAGSESKSKDSKEKARDRFHSMCAGGPERGILVGFHVHGGFGPVGELERDRAFEISEGVEVEFAGADGFAARRGEVQRGLKDIKQGSVAVLGGDLGKTDRFLGGVHVGRLGLDAFLRVDQAGVGFANLVLDLQAGFVARDVGGVERRCIGLRLALAGEAIEDIPGSEQSNAVVVLAVLEGSFVLVPEFLVGDEGINAWKKRRLVDLDPALIDIDLAVDHLQFGAAGKGKINEVIHLDFTDRRTIEILVDDEGWRVGGELLGPFDAKELA